MDDVELAIFDAWKRLAPALRADPSEFTRRLARRSKTVFGRPPRAWCLAVRASDTRIEPWDSEQFDACARHRRHEVDLDAEVVGRLCRAVRIEWPGEELADVARKLGVSTRGLTMARLRGAFSMRYVRGLGGWWGKPVPVLYTDRLLDPAMQLFQTPDPLWSWTANYLANRVPRDLGQTIERMPAYVPTTARGVHGEAHEYPSRALPRAPVEDEAAWYKWKDGVHVGYDWRNPAAKGNYERHERRKALERMSRKRQRQERPKPSTGGGSICFRGWKWVCPTCGKHVKTVYIPLPPINLLTESSRWAAKLPHAVSERGLGEMRPPPRQFACGRCHRVRYVSAAEPAAWNHFVTYLSGGLLFGRDVSKPPGFAPRRKRKYRPQANRPAPRREHVRRRLIDGGTIKEIAAELKVGVSAVHNHVKALRAQEGARDREGLLGKLGAGRATHPRESRTPQGRVARATTEP